MAGLYGRNKELGLLETLLARAREVQTGLMLVTGARGTGKSRFLESASRLSAASGLEVVRLNGAGLSGISLQYFLDELSAGPLEEFARRWCDWVDFYTPGGSPDGPIVVAIDDVDWCGSVVAGMRVFRDVAVRLRRPLVVVLACPDEVTDSVPTGDDEQGHRHDDQSVNVVRCRLLPLPREPVEQLAADVLGMPPGPEVMDVCAHAHGVPARLTLLLNGLLEAGVVRAPDGTARPDGQRVLPPEARALAFDRLVGLSGATRRMLDIASVIGQSFDLEALSAVLHQSPLNLLPAIREAQEAGVLAKDCSRSAFTDLLMWQAVRETVPGPVRGAILRDVGHRLLVSGDADTLGAGYLLRAAQSGDRRAASSLPEAVARRARTDPVAAAVLAAQALRLPLLDEDGHIRLLRIRADGLAVCGLTTEAIRCLSDALKRPLRPASANALRTRLTFLHLCGGDLEAAAAEARQVLSRPDTSRAPREIALLLDYCSSRWDSAHGEPRPDPDIPAQAGLARSAGLRVFGSFRSWCEGRVAESLGTLNESPGTDAVPPWCDAVSGAFVTAARVQFLVSLRKFPEAEAELREAVARVDASGGRGWHAMTESLRALLALEQGDVSAAETAATAALDLGRRYGTGALARLARAVLAIASLRRVDVQAAVEQTALLGDPLKVSRSSGITPSVLWAVLVVTEADQGPEAAALLAERLLAEGVSPYAMLLYAPYTAPWLVRTALAAHLPDFAARTVIAAEFLAENNPDWPILAVSADHARGLLRGDAVALRLTADLHQDPWSQAQAQEDLGGVSEDRTMAVRHLERAVGTYVRSGAPRDAARVRHSLRERGVRRRHWTSVDRPVQGWAALTETERTIARLVAAGMTNREAAQQMWLSHHTVNFHLRSIYRKLDISSRVKLAAMVHQ